MMALAGTGISRPIDSLGRVVIPKELRASLGIAESDRLEIRTSTENPDLIILKKVQDCCALCHSKNNLVFGEFGSTEKTNRCICTDCLEKLKKIDIPR